LAQIRPVTSESLEAQIRDLLPSQNGFTEDLQAQNVIVPIIDLTSVAEGSSVGENLQTAWDFSTGHTQINNTTSTLISNTGFWQVDLIYHHDNVTNNAVTTLATISIDDGLASKVIWQISGVNSGSAIEGTLSSDDKFVVFLRAGDSLKGFTSSTRSSLDVWYRQIADVNGQLVQPLGFTPQ